MQFQNSNAPNFGFIPGFDLVKDGESINDAISRVWREKKRLYELQLRDSKKDQNYNNDIVPGL